LGVARRNEEYRNEEMRIREKITILEEHLFPFFFVCVLGVLRL
jgi:hypothetical protein